MDTAAPQQFLIKRFLCLLNNPQLLLAPFSFCCRRAEPWNIPQNSPPYRRPVHGNFLTVSSKRGKIPLLPCLIQPPWHHISALIIFFVAGTTWSILQISSATSRPLETPKIKEAHFFRIYFEPAKVRAPASPCADIQIHGRRV
eukprot:Gregarina_sp_Poly_1__5637@NODE_2973_length_1489_cov_8_305204_g1877_i0_p2_GENE_NODE_2973_length_1489_cov_8_305204_g1877_i0NODE_2973_length_1489_cov_8_305204_g1877_i0_p2_ORF_typecomplete_len143_score8_31_NODE_2973_length_1489_cov_8_305204_g1877_i07771205